MGGMTIGGLAQWAGVEGRSADEVPDAARAKLAQVEEGLREPQALRRRLNRLVRVCAAGEDGCVALEAGRR
jgi:hypothetical protein